MSDNGKVLGALVLGAAAGAVLGLLFAPSKGSELRQKISDNAGDLIDELTEKIGEGKEMLAGLKDKAMTKADELKGKAEDELNSMKNKAKQTASTVASSTSNHSH
ncbi:MAG: Gas vesicle protein [Bacteroidetes bacterium]|nr:Gas vesicle protein [Bacteroidota bacterium]